MAPFLPDIDPLRNWNPTDSFWKIFQPILNPGTNGTASSVNPPAPLWDLASPYGEVMHPDNKDGIPHFVHPEYYIKLRSLPSYPVIHHNPPFWMIMQNFGRSDFTSMVLGGASAPAFIYAFHYLKGF